MSKLKLRFFGVVADMTAVYVDYENGNVFLIDIDFPDQNAIKLNFEEFETIKEINI